MMLLTRKKESVRNDVGSEHAELTERFESLWMGEMRSLMTLRCKSQKLEEWWSS